MRILFFLLVTSILIGGTSLAAKSQNRYTISGFVREEGSQETLVGVNVFLPSTGKGTVTNSYGFYSITLPADSVEIAFSYVGFETRVFKLNLTADIELNVNLLSSLQLEAVEVVAARSASSSRSSQMSVIEIPVKQLKSIPTLLGEKDALKVVQLLPGVQKGSEGSSGLYVRGGGPDQNLIILDDATVYNAYHLFGFFSLFNGDALKSIELTKGGFPARYGGRLSSVLDIVMKEGNQKELAGEAGVGVISSRLVLEGPIVKDKSSFIVSGRRTYIDALLYPLMPKDEKGGYFFYDLTAKANYEINRNNRIYVSSYFGKDKFWVNSKSSYDDINAGMYWSNITSTVRWNHLFSNKVFANTSFVFSKYGLKLYSDEKSNGDDFNLSYKSGIDDLGGKFDLSWHPNPSHTIRFGLQTVWHTFRPSAIVIKDDAINEFSRRVQTIGSLESGIYVEDDMKLGGWGVMNAGLRVSNHSTDGYSNFALEPRLSSSIFLSNTMSFKAAYAKMNQNIHLLTSTGTGMPTDLWVPATKLAPAQEGWQVSSGVTKDLTQWSSILSVEGYYKEMKNVITYREGASFLMFDEMSSAREVKWEDNITSGLGWSYGIELLAQRKVGKLSGWVGYTLSWTKLKFDEINEGKSYYARYDRRHDLSIVAIYEPAKDVTVSATWVYGTGNAITMPTATYPTVEPFGGSSSYISTSGSASEYGEKNSFRMAPYHRLDIGFQFHKQKAKYKRTFEVSVYNLYNRKNPFFYYIDDEGDRGNVLKQVSLFPILPSVSWTITF